MGFEPDEEILRKYADLFIAYGLHEGRGIRPGEVVCLQVPQAASRFVIPLHEAVLRAGGHPLVRLEPIGIRKNLLEKGSADQISYLASNFYKALVDTADHFVIILADHDVHEMENIAAANIGLRNKAVAPIQNWRRERELRSEQTWTAGIYGTPAMATEAGMTMQEYWQEIIAGCSLDGADPVRTAQVTKAELERTARALTSLGIDTLHIEAEGTDLTIGLGKRRVWINGTGRNIPSYETFTSPDWRLVNGEIKFTEPLFRHGQVVEDIHFTFKDGELVQYTANKGLPLLEQLVQTPGMTRVGEFSLTDKRRSRITRIMKTPLYDENIGGLFGNTHLALGSSFSDAFAGERASFAAARREYGFNRSDDHIDFIARSDRTVTATLTDGTRKIIYKDGMFTL